MPNIIIAVPAYRGAIKIKSAFSLIALVKELVSLNIGHEIRTIEMADVVLMRNLFASYLLSRKDATHLLFLDDDVTYGPKAVVRMIESRRPVIGCAYRQRTAKVVFNIRPGKDSADIQDGLCRVAAIGMGLTLIAREALERLAATGKLRKETRTDVEFPPTGQPIYGFFDLAATKDGSLTEDYSFCARWSNLCDGEIWAIVDEMTGHIGDYEYCGRFIDHLKAAEAPAPGQRRLSSPA